MLAVIRRSRRGRAANELPMFSWLKAVVHRDQDYPAAPEGQVIYAIGDIHGRSDCLARVHELIDQDVARRSRRESAVEIYIGDYVDRGQDSKGVIELLLRRAKMTPVVLLRGNHETTMEAFLRGLTTFEDWRKLGGLETILSYDVDARALLANGGTIRPRDVAERLPVSHTRFFSKLKSFYICGRYCFVHAGMRPGIPLERQSIEDLIWIRDDFLNFAGDFGYIVVHGHTPTPDVEFLPNRVNIDTGAYATNRLSAIRIDSTGLTALTRPSKQDADS
jgi:serine/threonine protein phosphatase 1